MNGFGIWKKYISRNRTQGAKFNKRVKEMEDIGIT